MEIQLQELIERIKKDGVKAAGEESTAILNAAREEADRILTQAKAEAQNILREAREENDRLTRVSEEAIRQAGRNMILSFRESVAKELDAVTSVKVNEAFSSDGLKVLIPQVVDTWAKEEGAENITVLLTQGDLDKLEGSLLAALKERMLEGVTLRPSDTFDGGFRIAIQNDGVFYDYSAEAVTEMLSAYLNPKVTSLLREAEGV